MAKKPVYEPGELDKVKKRLGPIDEKEAKRMQKILGGEVGEEKKSSSNNGARKSVSSAGGVSKPKRIIEVASYAGGENVPYNTTPKFVRPGPLSYSERVKMDVFAGNREFGIKTLIQVLVSQISIFKAPPDRVSRWFVKTNLNEYYEQLEHLVTVTRLMFPRSNADLGNKLRTASQTAFEILNTIRQWKLDIISSEIGRLQTHPRSVLVKDFEVMLREIYRPICIMEKLDAEKDIRSAFHTLYGILFTENPTKETENQQVKISEALHAWQYVRYKLHYLMYPLLMKTIGEYFQKYDLFFLENEDNYLLFLGISKSDRIYSASIQQEAKNTPDAKPDDKNDNNDKNAETASEILSDTLSDLEDAEKNVEKQKLSAAEARAFGRGLEVLETLFPQAPWDKLDKFPDFYPYFADVLEIKKNAELLAPEDPAHLALILSQIIEELLYGFRYIDFVGSPNAESLNAIVDDWHTAISETFEKKYLLRVNEYAHYIEHAAEKRSSTYAMNIASDIHWMRRYYFLPNYANTPPTPPSFSRKNIESLYAAARRLRGDLSVCAASIEAANREGGAAANRFVQGIENPWEPYNFQVETPLSKRLDMLLGKNQRNNASLIFFTLAIVTVLDSYLNDKNSIAYSADSETLFRNTGVDKLKPVFWVEKQNGTFALFKKSVEAMRKKGNDSEELRIKNEE